MYGLVVFSHLRWDFVYQRLQHLLPRLARDVAFCLWESLSAPRRRPA